VRVLKGQEKRQASEALKGQDKRRVSVFKGQEKDEGVCLKDRRKEK
jgi:hypothetical protein